MLPRRHTSKFYDLNERNSILLKLYHMETLFEAEVRIRNQIGKNDRL